MEQGTTLMNPQTGWWTDVKVGFRRYTRAPWITLAAVLCIALSLSPTLIVSLLADALVLRPAPGIPQPRELVSLTPKPTRLPGMGDGEGTEFTAPLSYTLIKRYDELTRSFTGIAAYQPVAVDLIAGEQSHRFRGQLVTHGFFRILAPQFEAGRPFTQEEIEGETQNAVIISNSLRRDLFGSRELVGERLLIEDTPFVVVGIVDERFHGPLTGERVDLWLPAGAAPLVLPHLERDALQDPTAGWLYWMVARLTPGTSVETARRELDALEQRLSEEDVAASQRVGLQVQGGIGLRPGTAQEIYRPLRLLFTVCILLLAIACANLGGVLLSGAVTRSDEIGIRLALGSSRWRLVRQLLTESLLLATSGGLLGALMAIGVANVLDGRQLARFIPPVRDLSFSGRTLGFGLLVTLLAAAMFGVAPALWAVHREPRTAASSTAGHQGATPSMRRWLELFVLVQLACTFSLVLVTGSILEALQTLRSTDPGFEPTGVLNVRVDLAGERYSSAQAETLVDRILESVAALPTVTAVGTASTVPLDRGGTNVAITKVMPVSGSMPLNMSPFIRFAAVKGQYFEAMGIPMLRGRGFSAPSVDSARSEVVVNRALAHELWPDQNPIGQGLVIGGTRHEVVGVVESVHQAALEEAPEPFFYSPGLGNDLTRLTLHVRSTARPEQLAVPIRERIMEIDPYLPVFETLTFVDQIDGALAQPRFVAALFAMFGSLALVIALLGLCGALAFAVRSRQEEFGVRLVLGARREELFRQVLLRAGALSGLALVLGFGLAMAATRTIRGFLYGVSVAEPQRALILAVLFVSGALVVSAFPAWIGSRLDPARSIRRQQ